MTLDYYKVQLKETAQKLSEFKKCILAVDESTKTIGKRLFDIDVENTEENRQAYRGMLFTTPDLGKYISGAILYEETLYQNHVDGDSMVDKLTKQGIIPGIKVDTGLKPLVGALKHETYCSGLDGLTERASNYYEQGARFAKWRAVLQIAENEISELAIHENAWGLARYARAVQEAGLVPIIEPEILMDGNHNIETTSKVQEYVIKAVYDFCNISGVYLGGTLLKPSMTVSGSDAPEDDAETVAKMTVETLLKCVPAAVPGIVFLSGGLSEDQASTYLSAMQHVGDNAPWNLSFSFGRALQHSCLKAWGGTDEKAGQKALLERARANSMASYGVYEPQGSSESLFVSDYKY